MDVTITLTEAQLDAIAERVAARMEASGASRGTPAPAEALTVAEAAAWAGVSERTIRRAVAEGRLAALRPGGRAVRISADALEAWASPPARLESSPAARRRARPRGGRRVLRDALDG